MAYYNLQYNDDYNRLVTECKEKMDKEIANEKKKEKVNRLKIMQLEQSKLLAPLFGDMFGYGERFRQPY